MPRSIEALKNDRKVIRVSLCLHKEIDAFRFSGPEQFSADAPLILLLFAKIIFRRRFDRFSMPRSIEVLKNDRKIIRVSQCLHKEIDEFRFSGPEQFSAGAPLILLLFAKIIFRRRFDRFPMPRSIEAFKNDRKIIRVSLRLHKEIDASRFSGHEQFSADAPLILLLFAKMIF